VYYSIETLEGNGAELGFPTLVLALIAALVAFSLRELCAQLARFVHAIVRELVALLSARPCAVAQPAPQSHPLRAQTILAARRLGRAPPNERCLSSSTSRRSGPPRAWPSHERNVHVPRMRRNPSRTRLQLRTARSGKPRLERFARPD
jgi:hypothetical protein